MATPDRKAPPSPGSEAGDNPGYAESNPRDRDDADSLREPRQKPNPDAGGTKRDPGQEPGAADD